MGMCGRFALHTSAAELAEIFEVDEVVGAPESPSFNTAPTQEVAAVRNSEAGRRQLVKLRWGLVPSWARDPGEIGTLINARGETLYDRPAFRDSVAGRRCLVPADGFYEWHTEHGLRQPYYIRRRDGRPFAMAGLWDRWTGPGEPPLESCTIITTDPNDLVGSLHDRMPVILDDEGVRLWLDPETRFLEDLQPLFRPPPSAVLEAFPVDRRVNRPQVDDAGCIEPIGPPIPGSRPPGPGEGAHERPRAPADERPEAPSPDERPEALPADDQLELL